MGNMNNKKYIVIAAILAMLSTGFVAANADNSNSLLQMDVKRSSIANTVDVTFYTTGDSSNSVVTRKSNNRYVVLLPNIDSNASVTPSIGGVKDMINNVEVKHVNDGIGGYTKITFETTKPINIKTYMRKTAPLTQAQKDYKALIAQNNINNKPVQTSAQAVNKQPQSAAHKQQAVKPVSNTTQSASKTVTPSKTAQTQPKEVQKASSPKLVLVDIPKPKVQDIKPKNVQPAKVKDVKPKAVQQLKTDQKKITQKTASTNPLLTTDGYVPKMKFDENGKRMIDLEPRVSHAITPEPPSNAPAVDPLFALNQNDTALDSQVQSQQPTQTDSLLQTEGQPVDGTSTAVETPNEGETSSSNFPVWIVIAGGAVLALGVMYLVFDAMFHSTEKDQERIKSFFSLSSKNQARRRRREYYDIVNNEDLSWQEKYKLYTEKEESRKPKKSSMDMSYVTDMSGMKKAIVTPDNQDLNSNKESVVSSLQQSSRKAAELSLDTIKDSIQNIPDSHKEKLQEKLQAKISQMEHALAQTPSMQEPEEQNMGVRSEDDAIMKNMSNIKLKSFSKPLTLKETSRSLVEEDKKISRNKAYKEGRFVKLKNSPLSVSRRKSTSSSLEVNDLITTGDKYLTNNNGEMKMNKENENYLLSSLDEYLSILDNEEKTSTATVAKSSVADSLSQMRSSSVAMSRSGVTNPISRGSNPMNKSGEPTPYMNGLIVKSGYNIDSEKGFYLVNIDGVSALVGRIKDSIFILKKFDHVIDKPLQVRPDDANVYIVRVGKFKCLVDVSKDKMGTLIEI